MDSKRKELVEELARALSDSSPQLDENSWPAELLNICRTHGYFGWFAPAAWGGEDWSETDLLETYLVLAQINLTTAFIMTQRAAAVDRVQRFGSRPLQQRVLPGLTRGELFATVGISHLTTSRQHLAGPAVLATSDRSGWTLNGESPWVTGAIRADWFVVGAATTDRLPVMVAIDARSPGVTIQAPRALTGLGGSLTGAVSLDRVTVPMENVLLSPQPDGLGRSDGGRTGGLPTSALALGHARRSIRYLRSESTQRPELLSIADGLERENLELTEWLLDLSQGGKRYDSETLRKRANDHVLRASQSALAAAKGTGYLADHPASRWCREALFFLVWSCPPRVVLENLKHWSGQGGLDCQP